jgi:hypothetical protein
MRTYVVNLLRSTARRAHAEAQLSGTGLDYEFVEAVDGSTDLAEHAALIDHEAVARAPSWLLPGIVGASLSHARIYGRMCESPEDVALVLEDDVVLGDAILPLLPGVASRMAGAEIVLLYYRSRGPLAFSAADAVAVGADARLMYPMALDTLNAAGAYLLTRECAARLREFVIPVRAGPDNWGLFYDGDAVDRVRCLVPRMIASRTDFKSTIEYAGDVGSARQRLLKAISDRELFPLHQILTRMRATRERRMSRFLIVADRSPYAR